MNISKIILRNFKSHDEVSLDLKPYSVIAGKPRLGKTSFLEAIEFVLLGTVRGSNRLDDYCKDKSGYLEVEAVIDGQTLIRSRELQGKDPLNRITYKGISYRQEDLERELNISRFTLYSLLTGQFRKQTNTKRRELLIDLLQRIDPITKESILTKDEMKLLKKEKYSVDSLSRAKVDLKNQESQRDNTKGKLDILREQWKTKKEEIQKHESTKADLTKEKGKLAKLTPTDKGKTCEKCGQELPEIRKKQEEYNKAVFELKMKGDNWTNTLNRLNSELKAIESQAKTIEEESQKANNISELSKIIEILGSIPKRIANELKERLDKQLAKDIEINLHEETKSGTIKEGVFIKFQGKDENQLSTSEEMELDLNISKLFNSLGEGLNVILIDRLESWNDLEEDKDYQYICTKVNDYNKIKLINTVKKASKKSKEKTPYIQEAYECYKHYIERNDSYEEFENDVDTIGGTFLNGSIQAKKDKVIIEIDGKEIKIKLKDIYNLSN